MHLFEKPIHETQKNTSIILGVFFKN